MSYVFHNLSDEKLEELATAVRNEAKRRFLLTSHKYPMLPALAECNSVEGIKGYRAAYGLSLSHAHILYNYYHR